MKKTKDRSIIEISLEHLEFDPENPRFSRLFGDKLQPEDEVIQRMIKAENVQELMGSIGEQGYFYGEPLLVAKSKVDDGKYTVVEGNRRLAALKLLSGMFGVDPLPSIKTLRDSVEHKPTIIPCIIFEERRDILRYLGYRHITGAKRWDSLSKARYLKQLQENFFDEYARDEQLRAIAREIGSRSDYVAQMLTGLTVYNKAKEDNNFYGLQHVKEEDVEFSLLTTALSYNSLASHIGLKSRVDMDASTLNRDNTRDLFSWMYAQDVQGNTTLGESRNLKKLAAVVSNPVSLEVLKSQGNLDNAYIYSEGPAKAFSRVLTDAENMLRSAYVMLPDVKEIGTTHSEQVKKIMALVDDIESSVRKAIRRQKEDE